MLGDGTTPVAPHGQSRWPVWLGRGLLVTVGGLICWLLFSGIAGAEPADRHGPAGKPSHASRHDDTAAQHPGRAVPAPAPDDARAKSAPQRGDGQAADVPATGAEPVDVSVSTLERQAAAATKRVGATVNTAAGQVSDAVVPVRPLPDISPGASTREAPTSLRVAEKSDTQPTVDHSPPARPGGTNAAPVTGADDIADTTTRSATGHDGTGQPVELPAPEQTAVAAGAPATPPVTTAAAILFASAPVALTRVPKPTFTRANRGKPPVAPD